MCESLFPCFYDPVFLLYGKIGDQRKGEKYYGFLHSINQWPTLVFYETLLIFHMPVGVVLFILHRVCVFRWVCIPSFRSQESASDLYSLAGWSGRARVQIWYRVCPDHWSETIAAVDAKWFRSGFGFCTGLGSVYRDDPQFTLKVQVCKSTHCFHFAQCLVTVLLSDPSVSKNNSKVVSDMMLFSINSWNY